MVGSSPFATASESDRSKYVEQFCSLTRDDLEILISKGYLFLEHYVWKTVLQNLKRNRLFCYAQCTSNLFALFIFHWPVRTLLCTATCRLWAPPMVCDGPQVLRHGANKPFHLGECCFLASTTGSALPWTNKPFHRWQGVLHGCVGHLHVHLYNKEVTQCSKTIHWRHFNCRLFCATRCEPSRVMHWSLWWFYFLLNFYILRSSYSTFECACLHYYVVGCASWFLKTGCSIVIGGVSVCISVLSAVQFGCLQSCCLLLALPNPIVLYWYTVREEQTGLWAV